MSVTIDLRRRWALLRDCNRRIDALGPDGADDELRRILGSDFDDPKRLIWISSLAADRANRLEAERG